MFLVVDFSNRANFFISFFSRGCGALVLLSFFFGCQTNSGVRYVDPGSQGSIAGTGIESQDVNSAAGQAAQSIILLPQISSAKKAPIIMLAPVVNKSSSPVDTSLFTNTLRDSLLNYTRGKVRFIDRQTSGLNRAEDKLLKSGETRSSGGKRRALSYDYLLTAELQGIGLTTRQGQSDFFRLTFKLISRRSDELLWTHSYQVKKEGKESGIYR